jgi:hypothetical protein
VGREATFVAAGDGRCPLFIFYCRSALCPFSLQQQRRRCWVFAIGKSRLNFIQSPRVIFQYNKRHVVEPVESAVVTQPNSALSASAHVNQVLELLRKLMEYRSSDVRLRLEKVGQAASMLHMDVLLLIYRFARFSPANVLEIGPHVGGSTIAAAYGARKSSVPKKF